MFRPIDDPIAVSLGIIGMIAATVMTMTMHQTDLDLLWFDWWALPIFAGVSAWAAGRFCAGLFGRAGPEGWVWAGFGAIVSTAAGAMIAGTFVFPLIGTLIAPLVVFGEMMVSPILGLVWVSCMMGLHFIALKTKQ